MRIFSATEKQKLNCQGLDTLSISRVDPVHFPRGVVLRMQKLRAPLPGGSPGLSKVPSFPKPVVGQNIALDAMLA